jgi:hypothetical protein
VFDGTGIDRQIVLLDLLCKELPACVTGWHPVAEVALGFGKEVEPIVPIHVMLNVLSKIRDVAEALFPVDQAGHGESRSFVALMTGARSW